MTKVIQSSAKRAGKLLAMYTTLHPGASLDGFEKWKETQLKTSLPSVDRVTMRRMERMHIIHWLSLNELSAKEDCELINKVISNCK